VPAILNTRRPPVRVARLYRAHPIESAPQLTTTVSRTAETISITFVGELDLAVETEVAELVASAVTQEGVTALHIDATRVTFCGSSGLRSLILAREAALDHQLTFTLDMADPGPVQRLVTLFALSNVWSTIS
jgi:anti-anti-sigma factor